MLQIISGKFFKSAERHSSAGKGILYSNYSWIAPIVTCIGVLEPVDSYRAVSSYVFNYTNQLERGSRGSLEVVRVGDSEIVRQFQLLCMFGLRACFSDDRALVLTNCRKAGISVSDTLVPSSFASRVFDSKLMGSVAEIDRFVHLVEQVIGLPRAQYVAVINVLDNLDHALQVLNWNIDLSYSMLVYCLESLSQNFDGESPRWSDYDDTTRGALDKLLSTADPTLAESIRETLLSSAHQKLSARFINFIESHLRESYFVEEAQGKTHPLRRSHLRRALKNVYIMRSGYVHKLQPIRDQLHHAGISRGEVFVWDKEPYLTFDGLLRLVFHVLNAFIFAQPTVATEEFNWRADLPGRINLNLAPEYWVWRHDGIDAPLPKDVLSAAVRDKFSGFLSHAVNVLATGVAMAPMRDLLVKYEKLMARASKTDRLRMLAVYILYNAIIREEYRVTDWEKVVEKYQTDAEGPSIENILVVLLLRGSVDESYDVLCRIYEGYCSSRFSKGAVEIPVVLELKLQLELANKALASGKQVDFVRFVNLAIADASGNSSAQAELASCRDSMSPVNHEKLFPRTPAQSAPEPVPPLAKIEEAKSATAALTTDDAGSEIKATSPTEKPEDAQPEIVATKTDEDVAPSAEAAGFVEQTEAAHSPGEVTSPNPSRGTNEM